nr:MAG TPA: hypothetical protein [Caudoviricetes sp.]
MVLDRKNVQPAGGCFNKRNGSLPYAAEPFY